MARRRITAEEVDEALANQETSYPGRPADRVVVLGRTHAGRRLKIVVVGDVVVTAADRDDWP
jgi:hypothetical protein